MSAWHVFSRRTYRDDGAAAAAADDDDDRDF